ncbi:hypothetical protein K450DRAFT_235753 [Umbelopsis ramanniana AG]|uniref:DUF1772-domain-containing protein n=1 Tax=Umbelopsis ramanniana AG TaxID=1314678 RepID=A0AAD5ED24_UMBRA|nr:uncharacterized protein K450DRAFT_235753 [Umbelopsis ramanniana AG]KAI8580745.1 hypothetical protein K450DRAFT_235753 [Umbelopsis ramanniana AG]
MNAEKIFIASTGLYAGFAFGVSVSGAPTIAVSQKPKDSWQTIYDSGKMVVVPLAFITAISGGMMYARTKDPRILAATLFGFSPVPFTALAMRSNIKSLQSSSNADPRVLELTNTWTNLHWVRTAAGLASFGLAVFTLL